LESEKAKSEDKQFVYYTLKLLTSLFFKADLPRQSLKGQLTFKAYLIEMVPESSQYAQFLAESGIKEHHFWDVFFRHNNFFIEKNSRMFPEIKTKDLVRADSLYNMANIWISCKVGDASEMLGHFKELKNKYKLYREVPDYALQLSETFLCPVLDGRCTKEPISQLNPEMWFPILEFLDTKDNLELAKTCRSLYSDIRHKAISRQLIDHPDLNGPSSYRKTLWLALVPKVFYRHVAYQRPEVFFLG
jgi:hypothetical protein